MIDNMLLVLSKKFENMKLLQIASIGDIVFKTDPHLGCLPICWAMEFLQAPEIQVGIGFAVVIVTLVAFILFSSKKTKGSSYSINSLYFIIFIPSSILAHGFHLVYLKD